MRHAGPRVTWRGSLKATALMTPTHTLARYFEAPCALTSQPPSIVRNIILSMLLLPLLVLPLMAGAETRTTRADRERGEYLVNLLACGRCHTEGYLTGNTATGPALAGSRVGIAYSDAPIEDEQPGLVFASNLTNDSVNGIGGWSRDDIVRALTTGVGTDGHQRLPVMPWPNYGALSRSDLNVIVGYLKSLLPVDRSIPARTEAGGPPEHPYVRFGIYLFEPAGTVKERSIP